MNMMARDTLARPPVLVVGIWLVLSLAPSTLRAEPLDRQVAEWVILMGGSVRLEGQDGRIRELTQAAGRRLSSRAGGPRGNQHQSPRPAEADRADAFEDPESPRAHVEPQRGVEHRLQPRAAPPREHSFARGADLQRHLSRIDQVRGPRDRGHRGARADPPAVEPGEYPGAGSPSGPVHESRGARPGLLPRGRRRPAADAGPHQAAQAPVAGRRDQRRGPAESRRSGEPRATGPGWDEDHGCRDRSPAGDDEAEEAELAGGRADGRGNPAPGEHDGTGRIEPVRDQGHQRRAWRCSRASST